MSEPPDLRLRTTAAGSTPLPDEVERIVDEKSQQEEERVSPDQQHDNHQAEEMSRNHDLPDYQIEMPTPSAWIKRHRAHIVGMNTHINFEHLTSESWVQYDPREKEQDSVTMSIKRAAQNLQFKMLAHNFIVCVFTSLRTMLTCIPVFTRALLGTDGNFTNVPTNLANFIQAVERVQKKVLTESEKRHMATIGLRLLIICMEKNKLAEAVTLLRYMHSKNFNYHRPSTYMKVHPAMTMLTALQVCIASRQYDELPNIFMVANLYETDTKTPEGLIRKLRVQMVGECLAVLVGVCRQRSCNQQAKPYLVDLVDKLFKNLIENQPKDHETVHGYRDMIDFPELHNCLLQFMLEVNATTHVISIYNCLFWRHGLLCIRPRILRNLVFYFFDQQSENGLYLDEASNVVGYGTEVGVYPKMQHFNPWVVGRVILWTCMHAYEMLLVIRAYLLDMFNYYKQRNMIKDGLRRCHFTSIGLIINLAPKPEVSDICDQAYTSKDCKSMIKAQEDLVRVFKKMLSMKWKQRDVGDFTIDAVSIWSFFLEYDEKLQHQSSTQGYMSPDRRFMPPKPLRNRSDTELLRKLSDTELLAVEGITPPSHPQGAEQPVASQSMPEMGVQPSSGLSQFMNDLVTDRIKEIAVVKEIAVIKEIVNNQIMSSLSAASYSNEAFASNMMNAAPIRPAAVHSRSSSPHVKAQNQRRGGPVPPKHTSGGKNSIPYQRRFPGVNKITADQPGSPRYPNNAVPGRTSRDVQCPGAGNYPLSSYQDQPSHRGYQVQPRQGHVSEQEYSDYSDHQGGQNSKGREISSTTEEYNDFSWRDEENVKGQHHWNINNVKRETSSDNVPYEGYFQPESPGHDESRGPVSFTERSGGYFALGKGPASFSPAHRGNSSGDYLMNRDGADGYEQYERDYSYEKETAYHDVGYYQQYAHLHKENEHLNVTDQPQARRQPYAMLAVYPQPDPSVIGAHVGPGEAPPAPQMPGQVYTPSFAPPEEQPVFQEVLNCVATRLRFHVQQGHLSSRNVEEYKVLISKMFCEQLMTTYQGQVHSLSDQHFEELSVFVDAKISLGRGGAM